MYNIKRKSRLVNISFFEMSLLVNLRDSKFLMIYIPNDISSEIDFLLIDLRSKGAATDYTPN